MASDGATPVRPEAYEPALDGLRALAVLGVVAFHVAPARLPGGWGGVELFFVLSGFLITRIVVREVDGTGRLDFPRFFRRRALRILPAFAVMLAVTNVAAAALGPPDAAGPATELCAASFTMNWCRAFGWAAGGALNHGWSLAVEEQFYLLWPPLLLLAGPRGRVPLAAVLAIAAAGWRCWLVAHGAPMERTYNGLDCHADVLLAGALLAMLDAPAGRTAPLRTALALGGVAAFALAMAPRWPATQGPGLSLAALGSAALIALARRPGWLGRTLSRVPLTAVGRRSYGIYLWHFPMLIVVKPHFAPATGTLVALAGTAAAAVLSWRYVEQPFLRLKEQPARPRPVSDAPPARAGPRWPPPGPAQDRPARR